MTATNETVCTHGVPLSVRCVKCDDDSHPVPAPRPSEGEETPLPCPWCHLTPAVINATDVDRLWYVSCVRPSCPMLTVKAEGDTRAEAIERWNHRSPSVPTATENNETNVARVEADRNVREIIRHFNLTGCKIEGATLRAFILGVLEAVSPVPSSEEAANSDTPPKNASRGAKLLAEMLHSAGRETPGDRVFINVIAKKSDWYLMLDAVPYFGNASAKSAARVQGENSQ